VDALFPAFTTGTLVALFPFRAGDALVSFPSFFALRTGGTGCAGFPGRSLDALRTSFTGQCHGRQSE
jgi:hypothetical protein